jgi:alkanesulfonate monooxygenase SsuD/methylene tetrahydromethanopterin reductase-like flavin-dependent oxidoreductase (luciferase family)
MSQTAKQMSIGMNILGFGAHASAWRKAEVPASAYLDVEYYRNIARISERGCLDAIFLADGPPAPGAWNRPCC